MCFENLTEATMEAAAAWLLLSLLGLALNRHDCLQYLQGSIEDRQAALIQDDCLEALHISGG